MLKCLSHFSHTTNNKNENYLHTHIKFSKDSATEFQTKMIMQNIHCLKINYAIKK